jgi:hypothetical protein
MTVHFASNFAFFFCLSWFSCMSKRPPAHLHPGRVHAMVPLFGGAAGNIFAGWLVDALFRSGHPVACAACLPWRLSRLPQSVSC